MIKRIVLTAGYYNRKGNFEQEFGGHLYEYYIEFNDGSTKGYCFLEEIQDNIEKSIKDYNELQDRSNY